MHCVTKSEVLGACDDEPKDILHQGVEPCSTAAIFKSEFGCFLMRSGYTSRYTSEDW
jgi:hypothetical protein